jgi:hypothetical protein
MDTCNHVFDEISVAWSINNGDAVLVCLELPQGNVNGDATFTLSLQFVQNPGIFKGTLSHLQNIKDVKENLKNCTASMQELFDLFSTHSLISGALKKFFYL